MILGIGIDVVENARIADAIRRQGGHFLQKIYLLAEVEYCIPRITQWKTLF
jgi:holo-[acyl-carrier protein] synthase